MIKSNLFYRGNNMQENSNFKGYIEQNDNYISVAIVIIILLAYIYVYPKVKRYLRGDLPYLKVDDLKKDIDENKDLLLIDVRSKSEFEGILGHIEEAVNIPIKALKEKLEKLSHEKPNSKDARVVFMGRDVDGGYKAYKIAKDFGFENVEIVDGGIKQWLKSGHKTSRLKYL